MSLYSTPVVATAVGAYRTTLPPEWLHLVPYGCELDAAEAIIEAINGIKYPTRQVISCINSEYSISQMFESYENIILKTKVREPIVWKPKKIRKTQKRYKLAPWCAVYPFGYYHDFRQEYLPKDELLPFLLKIGEKSFLSSDVMKEMQISKDAFEEAYEAGIIVEL